MSNRNYYDHDGRHGRYDNNRSERGSGSSRDREHHKRDQDHGRDYKQRDRQRPRDERRSDHRSRDRYDHRNSESRDRPHRENDCRDRQPANYPPKFQGKSRESSAGGYASSSTPPPPPPSEKNPQPPVTHNFSPLVISDPRKTLDPRMTTLSQTFKKESVEKKQNYRVLIDPTIMKGHVKVVRYDGILTGQPPVIPKDPRRPKSKIWSIDACDLPVPAFSVDKNYIGAMPRNTVRFSGLNNNVDRKFLRELCESYGDITEYKVYFDPKTNRHTGMGKVIFDDRTNTRKVVDSLNERQVMGQCIKVWIEQKPPPGYVIWQQLSAECLKSRAILEKNFMKTQQRHAKHSPRQHATPVTPKVSLTRRQHPIASSHSKSDEIPPPPPPKHRSYKSKYEDISPTRKDEKSYRNGSKKSASSSRSRHSNSRNRSPYSSSSRSSKQDHRNRRFSPLSNSQSPHTPKDLDNKKYSKNVSPRSSKSRKLEESKTKVEEDDDAMSLSSISSNEDKVELNVTNNKKSNLPPPVPAYPSYPPVMSDNNPSYYPPQPTQAYQIPPNYPTTSQYQQPYMPQQQQHMPNVAYNAQQMHQQQMSGYQTPETPALPQQNIYQQVPLPVPPSIPIELSLAFQVKTGCARDLSIELKRILVKDTLKKCVEQSAFKAFESWWQNQESNNNQKLLPEKPKSENLVKPLAIEKPNIQTESANMQAPAKEANTVTALLKTLFGPEKNNENRPSASNFLSSFRISRKTQLKRTPIKATSSRKRPSWSSIHRSNKQQRLEGSDDDQEEEPNEERAVDVPMVEEESEEEDFEQFTKKQRQLQKRGSSLYQKIYSDESENEAADEEGDDESSVKSISGSSDTSSGESSETSSGSESEEEEGVEEKGKEEDDEEEEIVDVEGKDEEKPSVEDSVAKKTDEVAAIAKEEQQETEKNDEEEEEKEEFLLEDQDEDNVPFRSMYDEPRRRTVSQKSEVLVDNKEQLPEKKPSKKIPKKPVISDSSSTETGDESPHEHANNNFTEEHFDEMHEAAKAIWLEHNYFKEGHPSPIPPPRRVSPPAPKTKKTTKEPRKKKTPIKQRVKKTASQRTQVRKVSLSEDEEEEPYVPQTFSIRSAAEEKEILKEIDNLGMDVEDIFYMRQAFVHLRGLDAKEIEGLEISDHPPTAVHQKASKHKDKLRVHTSGCARAEGYYKIPMVEKAQYLKSALRQLNAKQNADLQAKQIMEKSVGTEHKIKSRQKRAMQRRLASSIAQEEFASLISFHNKLLTRKKALEFSKSSIHNWGLFACEPIQADEMVCEYIGQMVRSIVAELRERRYEKQGIGSSYLFRLDTESVIDATKAGCNARFINHCCDPNCYAKVILVEGSKKIVIYSRRPINVGEEITYDYKFPIEDDKIPCLCGATLCRGTLN